MLKCASVDEHCGVAWCGVAWRGAGTRTSIQPEIYGAFKRGTYDLRPGGLLPLHCGLINGTATESLMPVLNAYPEGVRENAYMLNSAGYPCSEELPIVVGIRNGRAAADTLLAVFQAFPDAALGDSDLLVSGNPTYEKQATLLHYAMVYKAPGQLVDAVGKKHPEAAKQHNGSNNTPLRCGMEHQAPVGAVAAVLKAWPDAAKEVHPKSGMLPLHSGLAGNPDEYHPGGQVAEAVIAVLNAHPEAAKHRDKFGKTPLHYAIENAAPAKLVAAVQDAWPEAKQVRDKSGKLPGESKH